MREESPGVLQVEHVSVIKTNLNASVFKIIVLNYLLFKKTSDKKQIFEHKI